MKECNKEDKAAIEQTFKSLKNLGNEGIRLFNIQNGIEIDINLEEVEMGRSKASKKKRIN